MSTLIEFPALDRAVSPDLFMKICETAMNHVWVCLKTAHPIFVNVILYCSLWSTSTDRFYILWFMCNILAESATTLVYLPAFVNKSASGVKCSAVLLFLSEIKSVPISFQNYWKILHQKVWIVLFAIHVEVLSLLNYDNMCRNKNQRS